MHLNCVNAKRDRNWVRSRNELTAVNYIDDLVDRENEIFPSVTEHRRYRIGAGV